MLGLMDEFYEEFAKYGIEGVAADVLQTLSEDELIALLPEYDGWIIGDDPASRRVFEAAQKGNLRAAVKWGVGVDNVDFEACKDLNIPIINTPGVFGREVADVAMTYVLGLARDTYFIDKEIKDKAAWPKPRGVSTWNKTAAVVGFGDIGRNTVKRLLACDMKVKVYDPYYEKVEGLDVTPMNWPDGLEDVDFLVFTAPLNPATHHMFNEDILPKLKQGVRVVNVGRGPVVKESALLQGLESGLIASAALDVFEVEPLAKDSPLRKFDHCIFGSHNGSNTVDAVRHVSHYAIKLIAGFLEETRG
ncbi:MAG TPA: phosphoglycerate dehydrogenase [Hellea balneolensis]|uniref:Phosphoglycerate dehydrogenase n=1 Tax=Hellea balneolensis TaxID=287478 RepID=A0A7C5LTS8_9PROT|nr:phosphoglycerate dehydrogenase [Hellea balneolensis]